MPVSRLPEYSILDLGQALTILFLPVLYVYRSGNKKSGMGLHHRAVCLATVQEEGIMRRQYARPDIRLGFGYRLPTRPHGFLPLLRKA